MTNRYNIGALNLNNIVIIASAIAAIVAPTIYVGDLKTNQATQGTTLTGAVGDIATLQEKQEEQNKRQNNQDVAIQKIQSYIEYGILPRLELNAQDILNRAKLASSSNVQTLNQ